MQWFNVCFFLSTLSLSSASIPPVPVEDSLGHLRSTSTNASTRVEQTLKGLFHYFWRHDPLRKNIQFFFACGQIGGGGSQNLGACTCDDPSVCLYCYRWWDTVAMESLATHGISLNTTIYSNVPATIFAHSPYNSNWNATAACTFIDDFTWYGIAYLRVYEWLKVYVQLQVIINF